MSENRPRMRTTFEVMVSITSRICSFFSNRWTNWATCRLSTVILGSPWSVTTRSVCRARVSRSPQAAVP